MPISSRQRYSRFLVDWNFADGLDQNGNLFVRSGQTPTFAGGAASVIDANGHVYVPGVNSPCFHHQWNGSIWAPAGVLLQGAGVNLVTQPDAITAANGWTLDGTALATAAYSTCGALSLTRLTGATGGDGYRVVTLTGNAVKACSAVVQFDGVAGTTVHTLLYDFTASATRCQVTLTWAANGTATANLDTGTTLFGLVPLGIVNGMPTYRILASSTAATAVNTHRVYPMGDGGTAASFRIGGVMVQNAAFPSPSIVPPSAAAAFSLLFNAVPGAMTVYAKFADFGAGTIQYQFAITDSAFNNPAFFSDFAGGAYQAINGAGGGVASRAAAAVNFGDTVELRAVCHADGSVTMGASVNGAGEAVGATSAANALGARWGTTGQAVVLIGPEISGTTFFGAFQSLRIAAGVRSLSYMQAA